MKYFTSAWHGGDMEDATAESVRPAYWDYIRHLAPRLPSNVRRLAMEINLHDGLIRCITLDRSNASLLLQLRWGDLQVGYFELDLLFTQVELTPEHLTVIAAAVREPKTEVLYDEVDRASNGKFTLRLLFWPYREADIHFSELGMTYTPRSDRHIEHVADRFVVIG